MPVLVFVGFATFVTLSLAATATVFCVFWFCVVVGSATLVLAVTLGGTALLGLSVTVWLVSTYAAYR